MRLGLAHGGSAAVLMQLCRSDSQHVFMLAVQVLTSQLQRGGSVNTLGNISAAEPINQAAFMALWEQEPSKVKAPHCNS